MEGKPNLKDYTETFGYMIAKLENIHEEARKTNGRIKDLEKKVGVHDVILGKIGIGIAVIVFAVTAFTKSIINFVSEKIL